MKFYVPANNPDGALEVARDETWSLWQDIVDEGYDPDGITVTTVIHRDGDRFVIEIE